jgi:YVTN family beta-propeller protein
VKKTFLTFLMGACMAPVFLFAGAEEDALRALDAANAQVMAVSAVRSPNVSNISTAKGELEALKPFFENVGRTLSAVPVGPSTRLLEIGGGITAKVDNAGSISTVNIAVLIETCRGIAGDLDQWKALLPEVRTALQQRIDAKTADQVRDVVKQTLPTAVPAQPLPTATWVIPATPTPVQQPTALPPPPNGGGLPVDGGIIPGGWVPATPAPTPIFGAPTPLPTPQGARKVPVPVAAARNGQKVWVGNLQAGTVGVMDAKTQRFTTQITVGSQPQALGLDDGDGTLVVANFGSSSVSLVDARNDSLLKTISVGAQPFQVLVTHGGKAYVACQEGKSVAVIDLKLRLLLKTIPLGSRPGRMDLPNSHQAIYVTLPDEESVAVIDTGFDTVMATIKE